MGAHVEEIWMTRIFVREPGGLGWGILRFSEEDAFVSIQSDYGNWSHVWPKRHLGRPSVAAFLAEVECDYAGDKMLGADRDVYDEERTVKWIKEWILECRREGAWTGDRAREEWELLGLLEERGFDAWCWETSIDDACGMRRERIDRSFKMFWDRIWEPHIRPELRRFAEQAA